MKLFSSDFKCRTLIYDLLLILVGCLLTALALDIFTIPNNIAPGGVSGLATALAEISPISIGLWMLLMNIPLLLLAWRMIGLRPLLLTLVSTLALSLFTDLFAFLPGYTSDMLLASVFGGALSGLGIGLLFLRGISTGGTDLLALLLKKPFPNIPNGTLLLFADAAVVLIAAAVFRDVHVAIYSAITIFCSSKVIDALAEGVDHAKVIYTVTGKGSEVCAVLNANTPRGTTLIQASGGYTGENKQVVITVTRRNALAQTLRLIKQTDPYAFTFVTAATEVHGEGFKTGL